MADVVEINEVKYLADSPEDMEELMILKKIAKEETYHWQLWKQGLIMVAFVSLIFMNLLIKNTFDTNITCGGLAYWGI